MVSRIWASAVGGSVTGCGSGAWRLVLDGVHETIDVGCWYAVQFKAVDVALEAAVFPVEFRWVGALVVVGCPPVNANAAE